MEATTSFINTSTSTKNNVLNCTHIETIPQPCARLPTVHLLAASDTSAPLAIARHDKNALLRALTYFVPTVPCQAKTAFPGAILLTRIYEIVIGTTGVSSAHGYGSASVHCRRTLKTEDLGLHKSCAARGLHLGRFTTFKHPRRIGVMGNNGSHEQTHLPHGLGLDGIRSDRMGKLSKITTAFMVTARI